MKGTVKFFNPEKLFGFIRREDWPTDVFFHASECDPVDVPRISAGDTVTFDLGKSPKDGRTMATAVRVVS